jgi:hypothetical protein
VPRSRVVNCISALESTELGRTYYPKSGSALRIREGTHANATTEPTRESDSLRTLPSASERVYPRQEAQGASAGITAHRRLVAIRRELLENCELRIGAPAAVGTVPGHARYRRRIFEFADVTQTPRQRTENVKEASDVPATITGEMTTDVQTPRAPNRP